MPAAPASTRTRARRGDGAKLRNKILDQAEKLLLESGSPDSVSIRALAQRCEVTPPAVYLHFTDKDALFAEVCGRRFEELDERIEEARRSSADPLDELRALGLAIVNFGLEFPQAYRIVLMARRENDPVPEAFHQLVSSVENAAASGALDEVDSRQAALVLWAGITGLASSMISLPNADWGDKQALIEHMLDVLIEGLLST